MSPHHADVLAGIVLVLAALALLVWGLVQHLKEES